MLTNSIPRRMRALPIKLLVVKLSPNPKYETKSTIGNEMLIKGKAVLMSTNFKVRSQTKALKPSSENAMMKSGLRKRDTPF